MPLVSCDKAFWTAHLRLTNEIQVFINKYNVYFSVHHFFPYIYHYIKGCWSYHTWFTVLQDTITAPTTYVTTYVTSKHVWLYITFGGNNIALLPKRKDAQWKWNTGSPASAHLLIPIHHKIHITWNNINSHLYMCHPTVWRMYYIACTWHGMGLYFYICGLLCREGNLLINKSPHSISIS